ncbi:hypothetical protein ACFU9Y_06795 [Streptomyces sp. NPDC057621]|uniref:hypothetical protein n=1 Tax=Streptomyces sp. NPDC057621 TaxID=3346186 RepID=UPI0036B28373
MPDDMYGMHGDTCPTERISETLEYLSGLYHEMEKARAQASHWRAEPVPEIGELGGALEDLHDGFKAPNHP